MCAVPFGRGAPLPDSRAERLYPLWWAREGELALDLTCLSEDWEAYWVHWTPGESPEQSGRDRLCLADVESCPWCAFPRKWVAYLPVWSHLDRCAGGLVISPTLGRDLAALGAGPGGLYGHRLLVKHCGRQAGGGIRAKRHDACGPVGEPKRIDLQPTLQRVWGLAKTPNQILIPTGKRDLIPFPEPEQTDRYGLGQARGGVR